MRRTIFLLMFATTLFGCAANSQSPAPSTAPVAQPTPPVRDRQIDSAVALFERMQQQSLDQTPLPARSVLTFGAIGNNETDNTSAFQKALDDMHKRGGGTVL